MTALPPPAATVPFRHLTALWIQITGTWCNLQCVHCINASGPRDPWLAPLDVGTVRRAIIDGAALGVKEIYFTGGEPFLHPEILPLLEWALAHAPTTVLTNGTLVDEAMADDLATLFSRGRYGLEIRVSLDDPDRARNDAIRGRGAFDRALAAIRRLETRGMLPILTATDVQTAPAAGDLYHRLRALMLDSGVRRPRVKILPLFPVGRSALARGAHVTADMLEGVDLARLQCTESRAVAVGGVYACPILAGYPEGRMSGKTLDETLAPNRLAHPACRVCVATGASCRNA
jgi:AdoMet-dependent heme synthase